MHATNSLTGNWKPGGVAPSAPLTFLWKSKKPEGVRLTPPLSFNKLRNLLIPKESKRAFRFFF